MENTYPKEGAYMQNKQVPKDMRQPNSFQEQGPNISSPKNRRIDMRQPNSFQEQPAKNNGHIENDIVVDEKQSFSMNDTISRQEDSNNK